MLYWLLPAGVLTGYLYQAFSEQAIRKGSEKEADKGEPAGKVAAELLRGANLAEVEFCLTDQDHADHYDPKGKKLVLSQRTAASTDVFSVSTAAHETGHALQHRDGYPLMKLRSGVQTFANVCSAFFWPIMMIGLLCHSSILKWIGGGMLLITLLWSLMNYPLEIDASNRGMALLQGQHYLTDEEEKTARSLLRITAGSYVFCALSNSLSLLGRVVTAVFRKDLKETGL